MKTTGSSVTSGALLALAVVAVGIAQDKPQLPIDQFLDEVFIHGMRYGEARAYASGHANIQKLIRALKVEAPSGRWENAVLLLGIIGDDSAVEPLIEALETGEKCSGCNACIRKPYALQALGVLANTVRGARALEYLMSGTDPRFWDSRIGWACDCYGDEQRNSELAYAAIKALGLSGRGTARTRLQRLLNSRPTPQTEEAVAQALRANRAIAAIGLAAYLGR